MSLQEFVDSLSYGSFKSLLTACISRLQKEDARMSTEEGLTFAERKLVELGQKIPAIKSVRDRLGLDLKAANDFVTKAMGIAMDALR